MQKLILFASLVALASSKSLLEPETTEEPTCGISFKSSGRIVGGGPVVPHSMPWQVRLGQHCGACGGTLISKRHILTAAHCLRGIHIGMDVWVGQHTVEPNDGISYKVCNISNHDKWKGREYINEGYDFRILHLDQDVEMNENVQIACLPAEKDGIDDEFLDGKNLTASGWGDLLGLANTEEECPNELHSVVLPGYSNDRCEKETIYGDISGFDYIPWNDDRGKAVLCAGKEGKDACQGDSGGPLIYDNNGHATVVGVTSWGGTVDGLECGAPGAPGIFARVSHVIDWINEKMLETC